MYVGGPEEACVCGEHYGNHGLEGSRGYRFFKDRQESEIITCSKEIEERKNTRQLQPGKRQNLSIPDEAVK